ncbi:tape measure protein [Brevundimonas sp.]|uniref:tape measure protein n=1 Tax=Brevundimonas sp. TaxID=1871086 RepID=UPI0028AAAD0C|nr:tape measure protein [Brevundimonas sp.]
MAEEIDRLLVRVEANAVAFENQMKRVNRALYGSSAETRKTLDRIKRDTAAAAPQMFKPIGDNFRREIASLSGVLAGLFTTAQAIRFADGWKQGTNSLAAAGVATELLAERQERLLQIANDSRSSMGDTVSLYTRLTIATQELGLSTESTLRLTELLNKSFQASGKSTQEAASAALQLSQALASGTLQGDELRSLRENAPELANIIAKAMNVSVGELKKLGAEGKITGQIVAQAILGAGDSIEQKFMATRVTVGQSLTILNNELGKFVAQTDAGLSATDRLAQGIQLLSQNLEVVATTAGVVVTIMGTRLVVAQLTAATAAAGHAAAQIALIAAISGTSRAALVGAVALRGLATASMFFVTNPIGLAITAIAIAIGLVAIKSRDASAGMKAIKNASDAATSALDAYEDAARIAANATGEARKQALEHAAAMRVDAAETVRNARAQLELARTRAAAAVAEQKKTVRGLDSAGGVMLNSGPFGGLGAAGVLTARQAAVDQALAEQVEAGVKFAEAENRLRQIQTDLARGAYVQTPSIGGGPDPKKTRGSSGPTPEELARQRELLSLQMQIERLRAEGDEAGARSKQRELDVLNLSKQLADAGVAQAEATAQAHVKGVALAEDAARGFAMLWETNQQRIEDWETANQRANDVLIDQLSFEAELARLRGDPAIIVAAERRLWVEERINALLAQNVGLTRDAARVRAESEANQRDAATRDGERNYQARSLARDFVDVLASDDWASAAGRKFRDAAFDNLEDLVGTLFSGITGGQGGGNSIGSMIGSALRNLIPGFSAGTRSAPGGLSYVHKGEVLANLPKGTSVIPAHAVRAMGALTSQAQLRAMPVQQSFTVNVNAQDAVLTETVRGWVQQGMAQAVGQSVRTSTDLMRRSMPGAQQQQRRLGTS